MVSRYGLVCDRQEGRDVVHCTGDDSKGLAECKLFHTGFKISIAYYGPGLPNLISQLTFGFVIFGIIR